MKLRKCFACGEYSLKEECPKCGEKTKDAHYKFLGVRDVVKTDRKFSGK